MSKSISNTGFITREAARGVEAHWVPNTDVYCTGKCMVIKVELSGINKEDLDLTVEDRRMTISGVRHDEHRPADSKFQVMEIDYGEFSTSVEVPPGYEIGQAKAAYHNGFLRIEVPESAE